MMKHKAVFLPLLFLLMSLTMAGKTTVSSANGNPVLPAFHADPEVLFSKNTGRFYIYPTTDGYAGWGGYSFDVFSSTDLVHFRNEGTILNLSAGGDAPWASGNAWAPCIEEKWMDGKWKYFFYFSAHNPALNKKTLGVAVADSPTGPFKVSEKPLFTTTSGGQMIDSDVFTDPVSGQTYLYYGNGHLHYRLLSDDMMSVEDEEYDITPRGGSLADYAFREGVNVFYRKGLYYFLWSVDDTGAKNYHVAYGTSTSPQGPIKVAEKPIVIIQSPEEEIYGTGHNSIVNVPGTDDWYIVYHRINKDFLNDGPGFHREVCIDRLTFAKGGIIKQVLPTHKGIKPVKVRQKPAPPQREGWELVWHDEFNGRKLSDEWTRIPRFPNPPEWNKFMSTDDRLYKVQGGKLTLYGLNNDFLPEDTAHFLTGGVYTRDRVLFQRGRIDVRLRMDDASGAWPAAWLLPEGRWPYNGEIDIMERLNYDDFAHQTIHSAITEYDTVARKSQDWHYTAPIKKGKWNVYSVELYKDSVCFLINDRLTFTYRRQPELSPKQFPYDRPMYLLLDMQLGGHWVGRVNPKELPYRYQIDYVRFYKKIEEDRSIYYFR